VTEPSWDQPRPSIITFDQANVRRTMITALVCIGAFLLSLWVFEVTRHFIFLLLLGWLFAVAMEPGIEALGRWGLSRGTSSAIVGVSVIVTVLVLGAIFGGLFFEQMVQIVKGLPDLVASAVTWVNKVFHTSLDSAALQAKLHLSASQIAGTAGDLAGGVLGVISSLTSVVFDMFTVLVFGFYFAADGPRMQRAVAAGMAPEKQRVFLNVWKITVSKTGGYVVSKLILAGLSAACHGIFFWAIGVPYWLPFALFVGITAQFIPLIGTYIGIILPVLFTVFVHPWQAVAIIVFATIYQNIESYVFTPRVSRRTMEVSAAISLAAVFVGAAIWGPIGALIGIPLAAAGVTVVTTYARRYELIPELTETAETSEGSQPAEPATPPSTAGA